MVFYNDHIYLSLQNEVKCYPSNVFLLILHTNVLFWFIDQLQRELYEICNEKQIIWIYNGINHFYFLCSMKMIDVFFKNIHIIRKYILKYYQVCLICHINFFVTSVDVNMKRQHIISTTNAIEQCINIVGVFDNITVPKLSH